MVRFRCYFFCTKIGKNRALKKCDSLCHRYWQPTYLPIVVYRRIKKLLPDAGELHAEVEARTAFLGELTAEGVTDFDAVDERIQAFQV